MLENAEREEEKVKEEKDSSRKDMGREAGKVAARDGREALKGKEREAEKKEREKAKERPLGIGTRQEWVTKECVTGVTG